MRQIQTALVLSAALLIMIKVGQAQSLGDVARQTKQKQQAKDGHTQPKKVITNEDLPDHSVESAESVSSDSNERTSSESGKESNGAKSAEEWKGQIKAQKDAIGNYQQQIDKLNDSIRYVQANLYTNGVQYNQYQAKKQAEVEQARKTLAEQKKRLEDMQEAARKAGFGSAVYDP